ncbi:MAG: type IV secretion system DNA-binding domain-containing protein [Candidatus Moranbacteria bacterium]|nr:type IV secretion system DNA-binding domain-containing protein [Candidatus Moranbacteria bacterium]
MDPNVIFIIILILLSFVAFFSGVFLVLRSFFVYREQINASMNMDLEIVRVAKIKSDEGKNSSGGERAGWKDEISHMEQFLTTLGSIKQKKSFISRLFYDNPYISLEIANPSNSEEIFFYVAFPKKFREAIEKQIHSYFPDASIEKASDYTIFSPGSYTAISVLELKKKYSLPIKTYDFMESDPLNEISNALSKLETEEEGAAVQLILCPAKAGWRRPGKKIAHEMQQGKQLREVYHDSAFSAITKEVGKGISSAVSTTASSSQGDQFSKRNETVQLTPEEQELIKTIERKTTKSGFSVNLRLVASAKTQERADAILAQIENSFSQFENPDINNFKIKSRIKRQKVSYNYIFRNYDHENAMILNVEEISSIFHFPISTTETPKIKWKKSGSAPPPVNIPNEGVLLGFNDYRGVKTDIFLSDNDRRRHLYTIGQTGVGKSNFLQEMAKQDVRNGKGVCFIDPHGDAIEDILTAIPKDRAEDVIIFDPADTKRPFGLNMLEYDKPEEKSFVINEMIGIFDKLYDLKATGGPMFEQYARNAMLLIMEHPESGSTLMEIPKVLADEEFRKMKLEHCMNPVVKDFWLKEAQKAGGEAALANMVPYITSKLTTFISNDMMRPIIAQQKSTLNFRDIMDNQKILLVNLSKGKLGEINSHLLGMIIVGKILMAALSRVDIPEGERKDFYFYIDEFQNVTTDSISQILSEARKYKLNLVIAHQFIGQLSEDISKAVFGNVGSICAFRVGPEDAEFLEKQFEPIFSANDLVNVDNYNGFLKILVNNETTKPFNFKTYPPSTGDQEIANNLKELSRLKYGRDAGIVNREIMDRTKMIL